MRDKHTKIIAARQRTRRTLKLVILAIVLIAAVKTATLAVGSVAQTNNYLVTRLSDVQDAEGGYLIRATAGFVSVYYRGTGYPALVTGIAIETLAEADKEDILSGIVVDTREQLMKLMEDLGS